MLLLEGKTEMFSKYVAAILQDRKVLKNTIIYMPTRQPDLTPNPSIIY